MYLTCAHREAKLGTRGNKVYLVTLHLLLSLEDLFYDAFAVLTKPVQTAQVSKENTSGAKETYYMRTFESLPATELGIFTGDDGSHVLARANSRCYCLYLVNIFTT